MPATEIDEFLEVPEPGPFVDDVQYLLAYRYIFDSTKWFLNLLLVAVCQLIPFVGPIVTTGYQFEILEALHRRPSEVYPDFDFNRFVEYLTRGIWPFLVGLVAMAVLSPVFGILFFGSFAAVVAVADSGAGEIEIVLICVALCLLGLAVLLALGLCLFPITLRAGLTQDFGAAFNVQFVKDFVSLMWVEMLLVSLFMMATAVLLAAVGYLALCFGIYLSMAAIVLAQAHLQYQLYEVYLSRGGEPIPFKTDE